MITKKNIKLIKILSILIIIFTFEKILQHLLLALFFIIQIPGIGTPDIGPYFNINNYIMALLNVIYFIIFSIGLIAKIKNKKWGIFLIIISAALDIILEFIFHGLFFITISVIVSVILIIISILYLKKLKICHNKYKM